MQINNFLSKITGEGFITLSGSAFWCLTTNEDENIFFIFLFLTRIPQRTGQFNSYDPGFSASAAAFCS